MRTNAKRYLALMLAMAMLLSFAACGNTDTQQNEPQQTAQTPDPVTDTQQPQQIEEENYDGKLVSEGMMDIQYAQQFAIEKFKGGYRLVTDNLSGNKILVVPEDMSVPTELDAEVQVLQLPVTNAYICGSNIVAMVDAIGGIKKVTQVGTTTTKYYIQSVNDQLDSGYTVKAGGYGDDPNYEIIGTGNIQIAVWAGYDEQVFAKLRALDICAIAEENTGEPGLYGRMEWMRCLGVLLGIEEQSEAYYADQMAKIEAIRAKGDTGLVVGMGAMSSSSGKCFSRNSADFQADYIRYAGGVYNLQDLEPGKGGSATLTPEDFYLLFKDCDVLIWSQSIPTERSEQTMEDLVAFYPVIVDFKAYQNDQIYIQAKKYIQTGAADPACVVNDIHTVLTSDDPDVTTDHIVRLPWASDLNN